MINWIEVLEKILLLNLNRILVEYYSITGCGYGEASSVLILALLFYGFLIRDSFFALKNTPAFRYAQKSFTALQPHR